MVSGSTMDLVARVRAILLNPQAEWQVIARESGEPAYLFPNYVAILALIPALAGLIGLSLVSGYLPFLGSLVGAIIGYLMSFVTVYVLALIVDALAPNFGGQRDFPSALKLSVYSYTPVWLAGIFALIPGLRILGILGLYGLYLFWLGLPVLMRSPKEKNLPYVASILVAAILIFFVIGLILSVLGIPRIV